VEDDDDDEEDEVKEIVFERVVVDCFTGGS
jgi:hypothetical protein